MLVSLVTFFIVSRTQNPKCLSDERGMARLIGPSDA